MIGAKEELETVTMDTVAYVDVGRKKPHTVLLNGRVFKTNDLGKLETPAACLDALFPSIFQQVWSLLDRGVRVCYLRDMRLLETLRRQNNIEKSDENDARILTVVPSEGWKELTKDGLKLRSLLHQYYVVADDIKRNKQWLSLMVDENARAMVRERIPFLKRQQYALGRGIVQMAKMKLPYDHVSSSLGIQGISLVTLLTYVDFSKTFRQLAVFAGFIDPKTRNGKFSRKVRRASRALAATAIRYKHRRYHEVYNHYLRKLGNRRKALLRVQKRLFKDIWQTVRRLGQDQEVDES